MSYVLIQINDNWADEFDVEGFVVETKESYEQGLKDAQRAFDDGFYADVYFGTNEGLAYHDYRIWLQTMNVTELSDTEAQVIIKHFGRSYGVVVTWESVLEQVADYLDEMEDED